jgi:hypothetical protein
MIPTIVTSADVEISVILKVILMPIVDHKMCDNFMQYFPGKKVCHMVQYIL